jgi:hypothetical protein
MCCDHKGVAAFVSFPSLHVALFEVPIHFSLPKRGESLSFTPSLQKEGLGEVMRLLRAGRLACLKLDR